MAQPAAFRIGQSEQYVGNDRWKWSCWIDATAADLARITSVTWILHPTFSPSRVTVTTRENQFRLDSGGWGTFTLRASLAMQDGEPLKLRRTLKLHYPEADPADAAHEETAKNSGLKVFLSYSSEDERQAQALNRILSETGASVLNANLASPDQPLEAAVQKMIRESDAFVTIKSDEYSSHWVMLEAKFAQAEGKPMLSVPAGFGGMPNEAEGIITLPDDDGDIQTRLTSFIRNLET